MAFDDTAQTSEPDRRLSIVPLGQGWAIKHGEGFLGLAADREEAVRLLHALMEDASPERV